MTSLYEVLKRSKTAPQLAPDMFTALWAKSITAGKTIELSGQVPLSFKANGEPLLDYTISGNTFQNGTPTPTNPVDVVGVGERTKNYFDKENIDLVNLYPNNSTGAVEQSSTVWSIIVPIDSSGEWIFWIEDTTTNRIRIAGYETYPVLGSQATFIDNAGTSTTDYKYNVFEAPEGTTYILIMLSSNQYNETEMRTLLETVNVQIEKGARKTDYEPYGYKISISSANTTTPIYLGEVAATRYVKKSVLDGTENWVVGKAGTENEYYSSSQTVPTVRQGYGMCTHYDFTPITTVTTGDGIYVVQAGSIRVRDKRFSSLSDFKAWLATQYAAGTPVTVWYVLEEPTTGIVNEPLMRIGDYADTLSKSQAGATIPTSNGSTTIDVDTELKPSEVYIKYHTR